MMQTRLWREILLWNVFILILCFILMNVCVSCLWIRVLFSLYVIVVTVARVPLLACADGCSVSVATLAQWLQSSLHSFRIDGMLSLSAARSWLIVQHIHSQEVMNTLRRKAFHCRLQRSLFGNQVVLFTSARCFFVFFSPDLCIYLKCETKTWNVSQMPNSFLALL